MLNANNYVSDKTLEYNETNCLEKIFVIQI